MISLESKKEISGYLIKALDRENLSTREAAQFLNMNPIYMSMARNPKMFDSMSKAAWERLQDWMNTRDKISEYKIPELEEIYKVPEKKPRLGSEEFRPDKETEEHSPEVVLSSKKKKSARINNKKVPTEQGKNIIKDYLKKIEIDLLDLKQRIQHLEDEIKIIRSNPRIIWPEEKREKSQIIIFQRNIHHH